MKKIIEIALLAIGFICFVCICSEPAEGTSIASWLIWESSWWSALLADAAILAALDKKGTINIHGNGRA